MKSKRKPALLLTASISPNGMLFTAIQNPAQRLQSYIDALYYYVSTTSFDIVFCENTGYQFDTSEFQDFVRDGRLEFLSFNGNEYPRTLGKGYGEACIIDYAIQNSRILKKYDCFAKISGRHIIKNINTLLLHSWIGSKSNKIVVADISFSSKNVYSECILANKLFWADFFLPDRNRLNDSIGFYFESLLYEKVLAWKKKNVLRLFLSPILNMGVSGSTGNPLCNRWNGALGNLFFFRQFILMLKLSFR